MTLTERVDAAYLQECHETGCYLGSERKAKRRIRAKLVAAESAQPTTAVSSKDGTGGAA